MFLSSSKSRSRKCTTISLIVFSAMQLNQANQPSFQQVGSSSSTATCPTAPRFDLFNSSTDNQNNTVILVILTVIQAIKSHFILKVLHTLVLKDLIISFLKVLACQANTSDEARAAVAYHFVASKVTSIEHKQIQKEHKPFAILNTHIDASTFHMSSLP